MKKNYTEYLENRLLTYSITSAAILLATGSTKAQVWGTTVNTTVNEAPNPGNFTTITFNGNTRYKIVIQSSGYSVYNSVKLEAETSQAAFLRQLGHYYPKAIPTAGYSVGPNTTGVPIFSHYGGVGGKRFVQVKIAGSIAKMGSSFIGQTKDIGVRFKIGGNDYFGWIKITVPKSAASVTVVSYAYEQTAGKGINTSSALPVELTTFSANKIGNKIELKWNTATEVNNYGFSIERSQKTEVSSQNSNWVQIGFVKGNGNSNSPNNYSFVDANPISGDVEYRLKQIDNDGVFKYSSIATVNSLPVKFELFQNYPNPFNPTTTIRYSIPKAEHVILKVYDELGKEVSTLIDENKEAGSYEVQFNNQRTGDNKQLASGIYFYRITAGTFNEVKKLMILK